MFQLGGESASCLNVVIFFRILITGFLIAVLCTGGDFDCNSKRGRIGSVEYEEFVEIYRFISICA